MDSEGEHVRACRAGYAAIPRWCQKAPDSQPGASHSRSIRLTYADCGRADERTRTADLQPHYECALIHSWVFVTVPRTAYLSHLCPLRVSLCSPSFARVTVKLIRSQPELCVRQLRRLPHLSHHWSIATRGLLLETSSRA